jgi:hypothetical protein
VVRSPLLIGAHDERSRALHVGVSRITVGGSLLLMTGLGRRIFGVPDEMDNAAVRVTTRLFGIRNIMLGAWAIAARDQGPAERRLCYQLNAVVDAADLGILALGAIRDRRLVRAALMGGALGTSALLAWLALLNDV